MLARSLAFLAALVASGCTPELPEDVFTVFIEAPVSAPASGQAPVRLVVSGVQVSVLRIPVVPAEYFLNTEVVEAGAPDIRSPYLLVQTDPKVAQALMRTTSLAESLGKKLVLVVNDDAVGIMPIDQPILDGNLFFAVERDKMGARAAAEYWSERLNRSILMFRKWREKEEK